MLMMLGNVLAEEMLMKNLARTSDRVWPSAPAGFAAHLGDEVARHQQDEIGIDRFDRAHDAAGG